MNTYSTLSTLIVPGDKAREIGRYGGGRDADSEDGSYGGAGIRAGCSNLFDSTNDLSENPPREDKKMIPIPLWK